MKLELTKQERKMLCNAILNEIQGFNNYKYNQFVNTKSIEKYQSELRELLKKIA